MSDPSRDELLFLQLVALFQFAAMQQMGKLPNAASGKIERDLAQAKASIDMIEMLRAKTEARRSARESEYLDKVLFELRMNYVDEVNRGPEGGPPSSGEDSGGSQSAQDDGTP